MSPLALLWRWWCVCCKWMTWKQRSNWQSPRCWDSSRRSPDNRFPFASIKSGRVRRRNRRQNANLLSRHLRLFKFVTLSLLLPQWFSLRVWWIWSNTCERNGNSVFDMRESLRFIRVVYLKQWLSVQLKQRCFFFFLLHHHPFQLWLTNNYHDKKCERAEKNHLRWFTGRERRSLARISARPTRKIETRTFRFPFCFVYQCIASMLQFNIQLNKKIDKLFCRYWLQSESRPESERKVVANPKIHSNPTLILFSEKTFRYATQAECRVRRLRVSIDDDDYLFVEAMSRLHMIVARLGFDREKIWRKSPIKHRLQSLWKTWKSLSFEAKMWRFSSLGLLAFEIDWLKIKSREHFSSSHHSSSMLKQHTEEEPSSTRMWNVAANLSIPHTKLTHTPTPLTFFMLCFCYRCCFIVIVHAHRRATCHLSPHPRDSPSSRVQLLIINCESRVLRLFLFMLSLIPRVLGYIFFSADP